MNALDGQTISTESIGEQISVTGVVAGYPKKDYVRLHQEGPRGGTSILVDRSDTSVSFPRGDTVTVTGAVDAEVDPNGACPKLTYVLRL